MFIFLDETFLFTDLYAGIRTQKALFQGDIKPHRYKIIIQRNRELEYNNIDCYKRYSIS